MAQPIQTVDEDENSLEIQIQRYGCRYMAQLRINIRTTNIVGKHKTAIQIDHMLSWVRTLVVPRYVILEEYFFFVSHITTYYLMRKWEGVHLNFEVAQLDPVKRA